MIREATTQDIDILVHFENLFFDNVISTTKIEEEICSSLYKYFVYEGTKVHGYICISVSLDSADIVNIAVDPESRECGIGSALMEYAISYLKKMKVKDILLEVAEDNSKAISLYNKYNFQVINKRKNYYGNGRHAFVMQLHLK